MSLFSPLTLPNGAVIPNRIAKAAMEENMADAAHLPGAALLGLYRQWGAGGAGMLITGNVMVAADAVTGPAGVLDRGQRADGDHAEGHDLPRDSVASASSDAAATEDPDAREVKRTSRPGVSRAGD